MRNKRTIYSVPVCFILNIILVYIVYELCRLVFFAENWSMFSRNITWHSFSNILRGGWYFDTSAILYTNAVYALMMLLPIHFKETHMYQKLAKWVFVVFNAAGIIANLVDCVYFKYTTRRTTITVFSEFKNENNIGSIFLKDMACHWYIVLAGIALIAMLYILYRMPKGKAPQAVMRPYHLRPMTKYYAVQLICIVIYVPLCIAGMRGGFTIAVRPITISNANQYVKHPNEAAIVLNTPFSIIRTIGKHTFKDPKFYTQAELDMIYSPIHNDSIKNCAVKASVANPKNVVVIIVESFGREYIGALNRDLDNGKYKGYTPYVDKLVGKSLTFDNTFCNGRKSIDGMPSILSSIPMFIEPFFVTPASMNDVSGLAGELSKAGYQTAFFHGAENGSMGFQAFANSTGFQRYYGRTEYNNDKRFNGNDDFDGTWAIWDEPFLQYYAQQMSNMKEPFMTAIFTASSHHPFVVPEKYKNVYKDDGSNTLHKCIRYTDMSIGKFFETASKQPWFKNTIFIVTSDHTNGVDHPEFGTDLGIFSSPIIIYSPAGDIPAQCRHCIAQQIDIMPSVLGYLGYNKPYVAFGQDLFHTSDKETWAVNYLNGIYQYVKGDYLLQSDGPNAKALYNYKTDRLLKHNLLMKNQNISSAMQRELKAIIQSYMQRMENNALIYKPSEK